MELPRLDPELAYLADVVPSMFAAMGVGSAVAALVVAGQAQQVEALQAEVEAGALCAARPPGLFDVTTQDAGGGTEAAVQVVVGEDVQAA